MCGIFGVIAKPDSGIEANDLKKVALDIFRSSETRGKDASGLVVILPERVEVIKSPQRVRSLVRHPQFKKILMEAKDTYLAGEVFAVAGHTRMVTSGSSQISDNNQPVIKDEHLILHNGIIVNERELWRLNPKLQREYEVDTEIFAALLGEGSRQGKTLTATVKQAFKQIKGANTIASISLNKDVTVIGTSNGSMYFYQGLKKGIILFASERVIVEKATNRFRESGNPLSVRQVKPGYALKINFHDVDLMSFFLQDSENDSEHEEKTKVRSLVQRDIREIGYKNFLKYHNKIENIKRLSKLNYEAIRHLKRCSRCLLPETFPYIIFDSEGVCQFCRAYRPQKLKGSDALMRLADKARRSDGQPDCLVPISGGRDSSYGLHYIKTILKLNPVAYTYDWGFVTDLARRNISRICGSLGVEHILVAADIRKKRDNVRKNVTAWFKKPALGMIPLFMAGDKMFFYYASLIRRQMNLGPILFSMNWLEKTGFKTGFAHINDSQNLSGSVDGKTYSLSVSNKIKLASYYTSHFLTNTSYMNGSLIDTGFAFFSYYMLRKDYHSIFDFLKWDQQTIERTIMDNYDWETAPDSVSTWRIGDGTAPFYNYIYLSVAGFSEHDTFRSNQIREGLIDREFASELVEKENNMRTESFKWYCDTIGIDAVEALKVINNIPKRY